MKLGSTRDLDDEIKNHVHLRSYRFWSVGLGTVLAIVSLGVCAFGIQQQANLLALATVIGPVAGLAGIFIWGYRPRSEERGATRTHVPDQKREN